MTASQSVSIVIVSHNHISFIEQAIDSALRQKKENTKLEIIVVDDSSTDGTLEKLKHLQQQKNFQLLFTRVNIGPSAARNLALKKAQGNWVNFLDGDDYLLDNKVSAQLEAWGKKSKFSVCYTDSFIERGGKIEKYPLSKSWPPAEGKIYAHLLLRNCIALHAALVKTDIARSYKFDESLRTAEDYDFWLRIARDDHNFLFLDQSLVVYRRRATSLSRPTLEVFDNTLSVLDKHQKTIKTKSEQKNLDYHRSIILQNKADILLQRFKKPGIELLAEADRLGGLPRYKALSLKVMKYNFWIGLLFYKFLDARSRWRAKIEVLRS